MNLWQKILALALAGAVGTLCRVGLAAAVQRGAGDSFGWGTLAVNTLGCLLFGAAWAAIELRYAGPAAAELRLIVLGGFLGAFTTFSTYAFETATLGRSDSPALAIATLLLHNVMGITMVLIGMIAARWAWT